VLRDITPVTLDRESEQRFPFLQKQGEEVLGKVEIFSPGDEGNNFRFQDVDAGIDGCRR